MMSGALCAVLGVAANAEKRYDWENSAYFLEIPPEPYTLRPEKKPVHYRTFTDEVKKMWADPVLQQTIDLGIKTNRMGDFFLHFKHEDGTPAKVENVKVEMLKHDFLFGAQAFNVGGFGVKKGLTTSDPFERDPSVSDAEAARMNDLYEKEFANLFNFATVPFYWKTTEPESGEYRFGKNSRKIVRRPAPDIVLEFADKYGIRTKGHCLSWHIPEFSKPEWVPYDKYAFEKYMNRYIKKVAERYDGVIDFWDVSNEITDERAYAHPSCGYNPHWFMPDDYALKAFKQAGRVFSDSTRLIINFTTPVWQRVVAYRQYSSDYLAVSHLLEKGAKLDVIGLQLHFFQSPDRQNLFSGKEWGPYWMLSALDTLGQFNIPIHITEITFPCMSDNPEFGEANQAFMVENFYRLWFSHKNVEAITYWHFVDDMNGSEDVFKSGFLRKDFSRKPAYEILDRLINREWRTNLSFPEAEGLLHFRAFYGTYRVSYTYNGKSYQTEVALTKRGPVAPWIKLPNAPEK